MSSGTIVSFSERRRFGFIAPDDGAKDVFFHLADSPEFREPPREGVRVFWVAAGSRPGERG